MVWFELCHFLVTAHVIFFKVVPVPGKVSLPLYESTESCESLLQVEWQPDLSPQQNIFSLDYVMQVDITCSTGMVSSCVLAGINCVVPW